jgi:glutaredoxin
MMPSRVTLYVKTGCPWCSEAEEILQRRGISYDRVDVMRDRQAFKTMKEISGQSKAPTMEWDEEILSDFGAEELAAFLKEHDI